jgi:hypothetical protein
MKNRPTHFCWILRFFSALYLLGGGLFVLTDFSPLRSQGSGCISLFDGISIDGWNAYENRMSGQVEDGIRNPKYIRMKSLLERDASQPDQEYFPAEKAARIESLLNQGYPIIDFHVRIKKVIDALAKNRIALEINARYKIPSAKFVRLAKSKGVKFAFGTNNIGKEFAELDYCLQILKECDLKPQDMFTPPPDGRKPIQIK